MRDSTSISTTCLGLEMSSNPFRYSRMQNQLFAMTCAVLICLCVDLNVSGTEPTIEKTHTELLFEDGFATLRPGPLMPAVGPHSEYHYLSEAVPHGPWAVSTFDSGYDTQTAWRAIRLGNQQGAMLQTCRSKAKHWHPMIVAGDRLWRDYEIEGVFRIEEPGGRVGIAFRHRNDRCYYFAGIDKSRAVILRVLHEMDFQQPAEMVLASQEFPIALDQDISVRIDAVGTGITAEIGGTQLRAEDPTFEAGSIALIANAPARFDRVSVRCSRQSLDRYRSERSAWDHSESIAEDSHAKTKLHRKIMTPQFGTDRNLRFGDLNGDGQLDILIGQIVHHGPTDSNSEIGCMTAIQLDGTKLWQLGIPDRWGNHLTNDVAFQINDIDGNGTNEVIYCQNQELIIADGATGNRIRSISTPENKSSRAPFNRYRRILGDSLLVADLRGTGYRGDIVLKDRYRQAWAFDENLQLLWTIECNTGHFPYACDSDGDGRDEITIGYSKYSPDGKLLWSHDQLFKDHADSVAVVDLDGDGKQETLWGASDEGFVLLDAVGVPRIHLRLGHVQNLTIADLRSDLPGLEIACANFWKNQGIIHILDAKGNVLTDFEPRPEHGSSIVPVHWKGDGSEFLLLGPDPVHGGLYDGTGRRVLRLPADGHPTKAYDALNLFGDSRDEIVVWDSQEIWIYTQDRSAAELVAPPWRNSLSNESNYRARISIPAPKP
jgi:rhamnogalacturonan endolyase